MVVQFRIVYTVDICFIASDWVSTLKASVFSDCCSRLAIRFLPLSLTDYKIQIEIDFSPADTILSLLSIALVL